MPKPVRVVRDFINRHICLSDQREIPVFFTRTIHPRALASAAFSLDWEGIEVYASPLPHT